PPFAEAPRAAWFLSKFQQLGLSHAHVDDEGNALAEISAHRSGSSDSCILLSAHLDTVFPSGTPLDPIEDGTRILCPGACDNAAGLTALLGIAAALRHADIHPRVPI